MNRCGPTYANVHIGNRSNQRRCKIMYSWSFLVLHTLVCKCDIFHTFIAHMKSSDGAHDAHVQWCSLLFLWTPLLVVATQMNLTHRFGRNAISPNLLLDMTELLSLAYVQWNGYSVNLNLSYNMQKCPCACKQKLAPLMLASSIPSQVFQT